MKLEELSPAECRNRLECGHVGRLAVVVGGYPLVFPVNYTVVRDRILIRTADGAKLAHARFERVCFEVDDLDHRHRSGWSVLVRGVMHQLQEADHHADEFGRAARAIDPWPAGDRPHVLVITPVSITGRQLARPAPARSPAKA